MECTERLSAMHISPDGRFLLTGGPKGVISLMWLHSFQVHDVTLILQQSHSFRALGHFFPRKIMPVGYNVVESPIASSSVLFASP